MPSPKKSLAQRVARLEAQIESLDRLADSHQEAIGALLKIAKQTKGAVKALWKAVNDDPPRDRPSRN